MNDELLREYLRRVEKHIDFARMAYRSMPFIFWAAFIPLIYVGASLLTSSIGELAVGVGIGLGLSLWIIFEQHRAGKIIERLEIALGRKYRGSIVYMSLQILSWPAAVVIAFSATRLCSILFPPYSWMLVFIGTGTLLLMLVDKFMTGHMDKEMLAAVLIPLLSAPLSRYSPVPLEDFGIMIISSSMALTGFLYLRRSFKD